MATAERNVSRRGIFGVLHPALAAAQAAGVKPGDLPDLTIKEVKVYVLKPDADRRVERFASVVTASGIEGNYVLTNRYSHSNWSNLGWLAYAKRTLAGKNALDLPEFTSQFHSNVGQLSYASAMNNCLWDILGKAVHLPVYRTLGAYRERVRAYASSQHLKTVDAFVEDVARGKSQGFMAYKIHPPWLTNNEVDYKLDIEVAKAVRKTAGDGMALLFDRVGAYNRLEAMKVGHALDELNYVSNVWFEMTQPMGSTDRPYFKDRLRIDKDGYVPAPTKPGLGYEIDYNALHNVMDHIET